MFKPIESKQFPGMFEIHGYRNYLITRQGRVFSFYKNAFMAGSTNPDGYHNLRLKADDGVVLTWGLHRLMAFVFKHPGCDIGNLTVNHLDGIKANNFLDNLEWVTYKENAEHAGLNGLTTKCTPLSVLDSKSGVIEKFPSATECGRALGLSKDQILWRLKQTENRIWPEGKQYRKGYSDTPWGIGMAPEIVSEIDDIVPAHSRGVLCRNVLTGEVKGFSQLQRLAFFLECSPAAISTWLSLKDQPVLRGFYQIKRVDDPIPWRYVADPYAEHEDFTKQPCVVVENNITKESRIFTSSKECAEAMGISRTLLLYRLKTDGLKVFRDGYTYRYYRINSPLISVSA